MRAIDRLLTMPTNGHKHVFTSSTTSLNLHPSTQHTPNAGLIPCTLPDHSALNQPPVRSLTAYRAVMYTFGLVALVVNGMFVTATKQI